MWSSIPLNVLRVEQLLRPIKGTKVITTCKLNRGKSVQIKQKSQTSQKLARFNAANQTMMLQRSQFCNIILFDSCLFFHENYSLKSSVSHFFGDFSHTLGLFRLKFSYFSSPEPNLASPLKKKSIETRKSSIIPMKLLNSQKVAKV